MNGQETKVLVLGGTGAIGTELVRILADQGIQVKVSTRIPREPGNGNIHYLIGNAHDETFLKSVLAEKYDVIIDFMVYSTEEFYRRAEILLGSTDQYIFLSSSRVYADAGRAHAITEESPRLLDVCEDEEYLATDEYALAKARQENVLRNSRYRNWTIVRPYITYNNERLQLGVFEKEKWLFRALQGKSIVFSEDIGEKTTTMTFGRDVAAAIAALTAKPEALANEFVIAGSDTLKWKDILDIYLNELEIFSGRRPKVYWEKDIKEMVKMVGGRYQIYYDRLFERRFDNKKICDICDNKLTFVPIKDGVTKCLQEFITKKYSFGRIDWKFEAYADRLTREHTKLKEIAHSKDKIRYFMWRYMPMITAFIQKFRGGIFQKLISSSRV